MYEQICTVNEAEQSMKFLFEYYNFTWQSHVMFDKESSTLVLFMVSIMPSLMGSVMGYEPKCTCCTYFIFAKSRKQPI
jgi:hypothetical protein